MPRAWEPGRGGRLDPGWYDYPSLLFLVLSPSQVLADAPSYRAARVVAVGIGVAGVAAAWWLGRTAYGRLAGAVGAVGVAAATTRVAYSRMAVTDVLRDSRDHGDTLAPRHRSPRVGGVAAEACRLGEVPEHRAHRANRGRGLRGVGASWRVEDLLAVLAFALTSPFVLIHAGAAWGDIQRVQRLAESGWLRIRGRSCDADRVRRAALGHAQPAGARRRRNRGDRLVETHPAGSRAALVRCGVRTFAAAGGAHYDRYVLPFVPVLYVLAGRDRWLATAAVVTALVPVVVGRRRTRAHRATPRSTPPPGSRAERAAGRPDRGGPVDAAARPVARRSPRASGASADLRRGATWPPLSFEAGFRWLVVGHGVSDRVLAAASYYPREVRFYRSLTALSGRSRHGPTDTISG